MSINPCEFNELLKLWADIDDLSNVRAVLYWDEQTQMPASGSSARADHKATIDRLIHERISNPKLGKLLTKLDGWAQGLDEQSDEAAIIRIARREHEQAIRIPARLVIERSRTNSQAFVDWLKAREAKDYSIFAPALKKTFDINLRIAEALGYTGHPLNALLNQREPGMTIADIESLFSDLKEGLVPIVQKIASKKDPVSDTVLHQYYSPEKQWQVGLEAVKAIGFKLDEGRADKSVHPFSISFAPNDVRITTRVKPNHFSPAFFGFLHEAGHGHYMQGIPNSFRHTPLANGASAGTHESQSRTWENLVGRSYTFWQKFYPVIKEAFPDQTSGCNVRNWYKAVNRVQPSLNRVEADEVTYNLHIMIRFEIEKGVYDGVLNIDDLAEVWSEKFNDYLGITPSTDLEGILQDIHWTGSFGACFQGYTLGNVMSVQLYEAAMKQQPKLEREFAKGDFSGLLKWSREKIHAHGCKYEPFDLIKHVTDKPLSVQPYLSYIKRKFSDIYGLTL